MTFFQPIRTLPIVQGYSLTGSAFLFCSKGRHSCDTTVQAVLRHCTGYQNKHGQNSSLRFHWWCCEAVLSLADGFPGRCTGSVLSLADLFQGPRLVLSFDWSIDSNFRNTGAVFSLADWFPGRCTGSVLSLADLFQGPRLVLSFDWSIDSNFRNTAAVFSLVDWFPNRRTGLWWSTASWAQSEYWDTWPSLTGSRYPTCCCSQRKSEKDSYTSAGLRYKSAENCLAGCVKRWAWPELLSCGTQVPLNLAFHAGSPWQGKSSENWCHGFLSQMENGCHLGACCISSLTSQWNWPGQKLKFIWCHGALSGLHEMCIELAKLLKILCPWIYNTRELAYRAGEVALIQEAAVREVMTSQKNALTSERPDGRHERNISRSLSSLLSSSSSCECLRNGI